VISKILLLYEITLLNDNVLLSILVTLIFCMCDLCLAPYEIYNLNKMTYSMLICLVYIINWERHSCWLELVSACTCTSLLTNATKTTIKFINIHINKLMHKFIRLKSLQKS